MNNLVVSTSQGYTLVDAEFCSSCKKYVAKRRILTLPSWRSAKRAGHRILIKSEWIKAIHHNC